MIDVKPVLRIDSINIKSENAIVFTVEILQQMSGIRMASKNGTKSLHVTSLQEHLHDVMNYLSLPCDDGVTVDGFLAFRIICRVPDRENSGHKKWFGTEPAFGLGPDLRLLEIGH